MAAANDSGTPSSGFSDWLLELAIGVAVLVLGSGVWLYTHFSQDPAAPEKPRPIWLGVPKVTAQMSDGRTVNMKINLALDKESAIKELDPYVPAFATLIQQTGSQTTRDDIQGHNGIQQFGAAIGDSLNTYIERQGIQGRVKNVAFEELTLMP